MDVLYRCECDERWLYGADLNEPPYVALFLIKNELCCDKCEHLFTTMVYLGTSDELEKVEMAKFIYKIDHNL